MHVDTPPPLHIFMKTAFRWYCYMLHLLQAFADTLSLSQNARVFFPKATHFQQPQGESYVGFGSLEGRIEIKKRYGL